jgi:gliding motility-associated-like protein
MTMKITLNPKPVVAAIKSNDINCASPSAQLEASGAKTYFWEPFENLDNATVAKTFASVDTTTTFTVTGFTDAGCSSTATVTVKVDRSGVPRFVVPNAFTPNGDGRNDCFGIKRWGNSQIRQFTIFNRWGQLIFSTKDPGRCWDGTVGGMLQPAGVYIYVIDAGTFCGEVKSRGTLTLVR